MPASYLRGSWIDFMLLSTVIPKVFSCFVSVFNIHMSVHRYYILSVQPIFSQFVYSYKTLYMFQTGFPSIIGSSKLHIQRQAFVRPATCYLLLAAGSTATRTQHSEQYTYHTYDMMPHHRITYNDVVFFCRILTLI